MNAFKSNIYKYLGGTCQYLIPLYQRTYSWEREQCLRLWNDILNLHKEKREGHFVGSIVRINEASAAGSTIRYNKFRKSKKQSKKGGHALKTLVE